MPSSDIVRLPCNLSIETRVDGVYLTFDARNGQFATINIDSLGIDRGGMVKDALSAWCKDRQEDAALRARAAKGPLIQDSSMPGQSALPEPPFKR